MMATVGTVRLAEGIILNTHVFSYLTPREVIYEEGKIVMVSSYQLRMDDTQPPNEPWQVYYKLFVSFYKGHLVVTIFFLFLFFVLGHFLHILAKFN